MVKRDSSLALAVTSKAALVIGSRWKPGHVIRIDSMSGTYECINSPMIHACELLVQRALLAKPACSLLDRLFRKDAA